jgi:TPR repeat protein
VADNSASKPAADWSSKKKQADAADQHPVVTKQLTPGADEMNKAKDASDAAATAAWLWKATAKGNPEAPVQLANMYIQGNGVPRSCEQAVVLLKTAGAKQNAGARNRLAWMYSTGTCVPRNRMEAYRWLNAALDANPNSQWAKQNRDLLWQQMTPEERAGVQRGR